MLQIEFFKQFLSVSIVFNRTELLGVNGPLNSIVVVGSFKVSLFIDWGNVLAAVNN